MSIQVVNMVPQSLSGDTNFDSEPSVTVDPSEPQRIVGTAFRPDTAAGSTTGPYFFSADGGATWALNSVIPGGTSTFGQKDISVRFGPSSGVLYAGILRGDSSLRLNILRKANFSGPGAMTVLIDRTPDDQPWVETGSALDGGGVMVDRVYVSSNDVSQRPTGRTATVDFSLDAATAPAPAGFGTPARLETRTSADIGGGLRQDGPSVRTAVHRSGTLYGAYLGWRTFGSPNVTDVVVTRDDNWGQGATPFTALLDPADGLAGRRVETNVSVASLGTTLGTQRIGSSLTMAVDPRERRRVYLAWCDGLATSTSPYTLHVRRSDDGGQTWTGDLRTVQNATNPSLAVTVRGTVGLLYQQLGQAGGVDRWRTHLEISTDHMATTAEDNLVADVLDSSAGSTLSVIIGDYTNLVAAGKDFYGVFCGYNQPITANFPAGVTYQRNVDWAGQRLLANDNTTTVTASVDPFFVHWQPVALSDDYYVRDWTDNPTSGDNGVEPSTHPVFYATSDVWNRRGTLPGSFPGDQPDSENAGNGVGNIGDNWAFARLRRRAAAPAGSPDTTVTAHFLVSKLGTGSNFTDASDMDPDVVITDPDPTVTFAAADLGPKITTPAHWHLNPVASGHLCIAVEITSPHDPYAGTSLRGRAPGWPAQDLEITDDNNKAQRNMGLSTTPARGTGLCVSALFAIAHNAATRTRDMRLQYTVPPDLREHGKDVRITVIGGDRRVGGESGILELRDMQPGENRWIGVELPALRGKPGETSTIVFRELLGDAAVSGFGLGIRRGEPAAVLRDALERHRSVFTRLAALHGHDLARKEAELAEAALRDEESTAKAWLAGLSRRLEPITQTVTELVGDDDPFTTTPAVTALRKLLAGQPDDGALVCVTSFLERLDTHLTMHQLNAGDVADIAQNVRWQLDLASPPSRLAGLEGAADLATASRRFVTGWDHRKAGVRDYPKLVGTSLPSLTRVAEATRIDVTEQIAAMQAVLEDPVALQKAHWVVLAALADQAWETG
ncbi:sialidase family protein [Streptomyces sp. STR69]|uniref:sialidase family protein n=1 Tax=Streptomyces sp. STR69 TaxID=1796942 RepID=UPI0021C8E2C8|nr:sialidase family protein [Streptomyces sp. STR69]